jgi:hypothetical protein
MPHHPTLPDGPARTLGALALACLAAPAAAADYYCGTALCTSLGSALATVQLSNTTAPVDVPAPGGLVTGDNSSGSVVYAPAPLVQAESHITDGVSSAEANIVQSHLHYNVSVAAYEPVSGNVFVPIVLTGFYGLSASADRYLGDGGAAVLIKVNQSDFTPNSFMDDLSDAGCGSLDPSRSCQREGSFKLTGQLKVGLQMSVDMYAIASSQEYGKGGFGSGAAWIDPVISIDPAFADAAKYVVLLSEGIGNAAAVPEPANAAMLLAGSLLLSGTARRRARRAS